MKMDKGFRIIRAQEMAWQLGRLLLQLWLQRVSGLQWEQKVNQASKEFRIFSDANDKWNTMRRNKVIFYLFNRFLGMGFKRTCDSLWIYSTVTSLITV